MKYRNRETGAIATAREIKAEHYNVSFGPNTFGDLGYDVVFQTPKPAPSTELKTIVSDSVVQDANGNWTEAWTERDMFSDYEDAEGVVVTKVEQEAAYLADKTEKEALAAAEASKKEGIEILGVMCSATKDDQNGMVAVGTSKLMADMGGVPFADTVFEFTNGNKLVITAANFNTVYAAWVPFRQSFFAP
jgi:hypothetical protein